MHIFEFTFNVTTSEVECVRRGSAKALTPLSAFARTPSHYGTDSLNATEVADHMLSLFEHAADIIPEIYHNTTPVKYQASAGMRLIDESEQVAVYDALYEGLRESDRFVFHSMKREDVATLGGIDEGLYGAVAVNYLKGVVGADLKVKAKPQAAASGDENDEHQLHHHGPLGALDMGGASAQIVYLPELAMGGGCEGGSCSPEDPHGSGNNDDGDADKTCSASQSAFDRLNGDAFFSTSYLAYGADQFRERLWDVWIDDELKGADPNACVAKELTISNPCGFIGLEQKFKGFTFIGTGDAKICSKQIRRLIPHHELIVGPETTDESTDLGFSEGGVVGVVGGVVHPPLRGIRFFAMSLFFFALDCLRELSGHEALHMNWPTPTLEEIDDALDGLCSRNWHGDLDDIGEQRMHRFTRADILPHRCMEAVYIATLLRHGFGFHPKARDITFAFDVEGSEVEWSLGMALSEAGSLDWLSGEGEDEDGAAEVVPLSISISNGANGPTGANSDDRKNDSDTNATSKNDCASQTCPSVWVEDR